MSLQNLIENIDSEQSDIDLLIREFSRANFYHVNDTDIHKKMSDTFCSRVTKHLEQYEKLLKAVKLQREALDDISILNELGPYEAIRGPRIAHQAIEAADKVATEGI